MSINAIGSLSTATAASQSTAAFSSTAASSSSAASSSAQSGSSSQSAGGSGEAGGGGGSSAKTIVSEVSTTVNGITTTTITYSDGSTEVETTASAQGSQGGQAGQSYTAQGTVQSASAKSTSSEGIGG